MKKFWIVLFLILVFLLFPIRCVLSDGGTVVYQSILYEIQVLHRLSFEGYQEGLEVRLFGNLVYQKIEEKKEGNSTMNLIINGKTFEMVWEENDTSSAFLAMLPKTLTFSPLNGNEYYSYLNEDLPNQPSPYDTIREGDVMLYGNDCLVFFYETFDTSYSYTKIGHISNVQELLEMLEDSPVLTIEKSKE